MSAKPYTTEPALARTANDLARDLMRPEARIYWLDLVATTAVTYASLGLAVTATTATLMLIAGAVCVLSLYRAISFIHELTHLRSDEAPGFHFAWNLLIGVPFLTPSLLYEGVHILHHAKDRYGTTRDPEYHPLARLSPHHLAAFLAIALLGPVAVVLRFALMAPLGFLIPQVRRLATARMSAIIINLGFAREDFDRARKAPWLAQEISCWLWSWTLIGLAGFGFVPLRALVITGVIYALMAFLNQLRTAAAHRWENGGAQMVPLDQFRDTVNVPPPALAPFLWAPVGLRYHALHHLMPRLPYHNLGAAHRRLVAALPINHVYREAEEAELGPAIGRLVAQMKKQTG